MQIVNEVKRALFSLLIFDLSWLSSVGCEVLLFQTSRLFHRCTVRHPSFSQYIGSSRHVWPCLQFHNQPTCLFRVNKHRYTGRHLSFILYMIDDRWSPVDLLRSSGWVGLWQGMTLLVYSCFSDWSTSCVIFPHFIVPTDCETKLYSKCRSTCLIFHWWPINLFTDSRTTAHF